MRSGPDELYCEIHVDAPGGERELLDLAAEALGSAAERSRSGLRTREVDIEITPTDAWDPTEPEPTPGDFLRFRYRLEIDPAPGASADEYKRAIRRLLLGLWARGAKAVAGCLFEHELPYRGGIDRP